MQKLVYRAKAEERTVDFREESGLGQPQFEVLEPKAVNEEEDIILTQQSDEMETVGEFVEQLYHIYLGRASDPAGKSDWVGQLDRGISRNSIVWGFENSREFEQTCERYGIRQGSAVTKNAKLYTKVADFVANYYQGFLKREPDEEGLENWTTLLVNGGTAADLTKGFVFSPEFQNQNVNKEDFVECLYSTYLQRNSDAAGKQSWVQQLPTMSWSEKENVIKGFLYSQEYRELCEKYGIDIGNL